MKPRWLRRFLVVSSSAVTLVAIGPLHAQQGATVGGDPVPQFIALALP